jgi:HSP90 family molecular chaperone
MSEYGILEMFEGELYMKGEFGGRWPVEYTTTKSLKEKITFAKYVQRMKEGQTHIYYVTRAAEVLTVPMLEACLPFIRNDVEVLFIVGAEASTLLQNLDTTRLVAVKSVEDMSAEELIHALPGFRVD